MNEFFSKYVGPGSGQLARVVAAEPVATLVALDVDAENTAVSPLLLRPEQAKALGRALIKAGKFVDRVRAAAAKGGAT